MAEEEKKAAEAADKKEAKAESKEAAPAEEPKEAAKEEAKAPEASKETAPAEEPKEAAKEEAKAPEASKEEASAPKEEPKEDAQKPEVSGTKEKAEAPLEEAPAKEKGGKLELEGERVFEIVEAVKASGKIKKGINEVTKCMEKGTAKMVVVAKDISPPEVVMHLPLLAKEKAIPFAEVDTKEELGAAAGLDVPTSCIAVIAEGEAKDAIKELTEE